MEERPHRHNKDNNNVNVTTHNEEEGSDNTNTADIEMIMQYHEETKHHFHRYAKSSGHLDWANQPLPWRIFEGAPTTHLNTEPPDPAIPYPQLYHLLPLSSPQQSQQSQQPQQPQHPHPQLEIEKETDKAAPEHKQMQHVAVDITSISTFLFNSLALSAWKKHKNDSWSLRVNPSSGNLHPTEGYLILPSLDEEGASAVYHYLPLTHSLERRCPLRQQDSERLFAWGRQHIVTESGSLEGAQMFFVALTSIHWRESWKYGERAYRYCNHDVGHAYGALRFAASLLGWQVVMLNGTKDSSLATLLGIDRRSDFRDLEREEPELLALVIAQNNQHPIHKINPCKASQKTDIPSEIVEAMKESQEWKGKAKPLSKEHVEWKIITKAAAAAKKRVVETASDRSLPTHSYLKYDQLPLEYRQFMTHKTASQIIRQRRSALDFDGTTTITSGQFYGILSRVVPALTEVPWDAWPPEWGTKVHLALFVHRVEGLPPGLYFLLRDESQLAAVKDTISHGREDLQFAWIKLTEEHGAPPGLPLYLLARGDVRNPAMRVSCEQEIAGDGVFSLGMIADYEDTISKEGAHAYRRLFWETGLVGQVLYLEAEAQGIRATGIGCFFDDPVHSIFGFSNSRKYQSLYHFTMGGPVEDTRLRTLRAYKAEE